MDTAVVAHLLHERADPKQAARGEDLPFFWGKGIPHILENSRSAHAGAHTAMEMANGHVAITRELLGAEPGEECEPPPDEADWEC